MEQGPYGGPRQASGVQTKELLADFIPGLDKDWENCGPSHRSRKKKYSLTLRIQDYPEIS